jgi:phosphatidylserine/phosphatidylglycerophosphate/cardiolipin synthase-like enzyme
MSIELITENHGQEIKGILLSTQNTIKIISPFMARTTCEELAKIIKGGIGCQIITRFYREDFIQNASNLDGLLSLIEAGAEIRALIGLHTKLYIFDSNYSIITSANYTYKGFYTNYEL